MQISMAKGRVKGNGLWETNESEIELYGARAKSGNATTAGWTINVSQGITSSIDNKMHILSQIQTWWYTWYIIDGSLLIYIIDYYCID